MFLSFSRHHPGRVFDYIGSEAKELGWVGYKNTLLCRLARNPIREQIKQRCIIRLGVALCRMRPVSAPKRPFRRCLNVSAGDSAAVRVIGRAYLAILVWLRQLHPNAAGIDQTMYSGETRMRHTFRFGMRPR